MILTQFDDAALPGQQSKFEFPRVAVHETLVPTGSRGGAYDLYGVRSPIQELQYGYEFLFTGGERTRLEEVLAKVGYRSTLKAKMYDGSYRQCQAKMLSAAESTSESEETALALRSVKCVFAAEPYWYDDMATQVDLAASTQALLLNDGNARAIRGLKFTINPTVTSGFTITNQTNGQYLTVNTTISSALMVDCGLQLVLVGSTNVYANTARPDTQIEFLSLEPGINQIVFSLAVTGQIEYRSCWL